MPLAWGASLLWGSAAAWLGYSVGAPEPEDEPTNWAAIFAVVGVFALAAFYISARWVKRRS